MVSVTIANGRSALKRPQYPEIPADRPVHGSRTSFGDKVEAGTSYSVAVAAKAHFQVEGLRFSIDELDFYLDNHPDGTWYEMSLEHQTLDVDHPIVSQRISKALEILVDKALDRAISNPSMLGVLQEELSDWLFIEQAELADTPDLKNSLGGHKVAVSAEITIYDPESNQGFGAPNRYSAEVRYTPFIHDYYVFHGTATSFIGSAVDTSMRELEEFGWARSFPVRGESIVRGWRSPIGAVVSDGN